MHTCRRGRHRCLPPASCSRISSKEVPLRLAGKPRSGTTSTAEPFRLTHRCEDLAGYGFRGSARVAPPGSVVLEYRGPGPERKVAASGSVVAPRLGSDVPDHRPPAGLTVMPRRADACRRRYGCETRMVVLPLTPFHHSPATDQNQKGDVVAGFVSPAAPERPSPWMSDKRNEDGVREHKAAATTAAILSITGTVLRRDVGDPFCRRRGAVRCRGFLGKGSWVMLTTLMGWRVRGAGVGAARHVRMVALAIGVLLLAAVAPSQATASGVGTRDGAASPQAVTGYSAFAWGANETGQLGNGRPPSGGRRGGSSAPAPSGPRFRPGAPTQSRSRPTARCGRGATTSTTQARGRRLHQQ